MSKTIVITGVSTGLGQALASAALQAGHRVVGTVRKPADATAFENLKSGHAIARILDVTETDKIKPMVDGIAAEFGAIDVLVNNAGYGHEGILEEASLDEMRHQFEVNVFGAVAMIQAVLPHMRKRRAGRILNITSMGGIITLPGISLYHGSKFALEGISESLGKEVKALGIHVTAVEPGSFRTDWAGRSLVRGERSISDYDAVMNPIRENRKNYSGNQLGDPHKAALAMLTLIEAENPPYHLILGSDALRLVEEKLSALKRDIATWQELSRSTDFTNA
jgi:NAD(P)-dependent dehydrogenase (short-subunit alcohol dehydrogenase family)